MNILHSLSQRLRSALKMNHTKGLKNKSRLEKNCFENPLYLHRGAEQCTGSRRSLKTKVEVKQGPSKGLQGPDEVILLKSNLSGSIKFVAYC